MMGRETRGRSSRESRPLARAGACAGIALLALAGAGAWAAAGDAAPSGEPAIAPGVREALEREGDPEAGAQAYRSCAVCHRPDGRGRPDGTFPQLAGQHRQVIVKQLVDIREGRRRNPIMQPFAEALLDAQELADVAAYIETLPVPAPETPDAEADLEEGRRLYRRDCQGCHGPRAEGDGERFVPMLAHQHESYLLRQIRSIAAGRRENAHPQMERLVAGYTDAQLQAVVAFATRLPGARGSEPPEPEGERPRVQPADAAASAPTAPEEPATGATRSAR
jgi:cytochrome c553